jgi:hypothetical protein
MRNRFFGITLKNSAYLTLPPVFRIECGQNAGQWFLGFTYLKTPIHQLPIPQGIANIRLRMLSFSFLWWFISLNWSTCRFTKRFSNLES